MTSLTTCADADGAAERAAGEIVRRLESARSERGAAHLALSGGSTPARTYELLAQQLESWERVDVWFADERCVGPEDDESNYLLAKQTLLSAASGLDPQRVHRMEGELGPEQGAERYAHELREHAPIEDGLPVLDVIVLGIGPDGHIASLFPGAKTLDAPAAGALPRRARLAEAAAGADHADAVGAACGAALRPAGYWRGQGRRDRCDARGAEQSRAGKPAAAGTPQRDRRRRRLAGTAERPVDGSEWHAVSCRGPTVGRAKRWLPTH